MAHISRKLLLPPGTSDSLARKFVEVSNGPACRDRMPRLLVCWPTARMNAFQSLLYGQGHDSGYAVHRLRNFEELDTIFWPGEVLFHVHWFGPLVRKAETAEAYAANIERVFTILESFQRRTNAKLLWTAHNLLPHSSQYPNLDTALRQRVLEDFDGVHLLETEHEAELERAFERRPRYTFTAHHPHYRTAYPSQIERAEARELLGFDAGATIVLFFGSVQRYKGINRLIEAFQFARDIGRTDLRLVIAGFPSDEEYVSELSDIVEKDEAIRYLPSKVPDDQMQIFFRGCDVVALPYTGDQLNSGAAILALSFDRDIIAPAEPAFRSFERFGVQTYCDNNKEGLRDAILNFRPRANSIDFQAFRAKYDPESTSRTFFAGIDTMFAK